MPLHDGWQKWTEAGKVKSTYQIEKWICGGRGGRPRKTKICSVQHKLAKSTMADSNLRAEIAKGAELKHAETSDKSGPHIEGTMQ